MPRLTKMADNITVDYDHDTVTIDGMLVPYLLAEPGPIVAANYQPCVTPQVTVTLLAEEVTVRGIPTPGTRSPHTGPAHVRLWNHDWQLIGPIDEGWRADEPLAFTLNREHPIAARILDHNPGSQADYRLTVDYDGRRISGYLKAWEIVRTRLGDLLIARFVEGY